MRIILHIGMYKTGTTAIQQFFARSRSVLAKSGVLYPASFTRYNAHHPLPWALGVGHPDKKGTVQPEEITNDILQEAASTNAKCLILSSEEFVQLESVEALQWLKQLFDGHTIEVVIFLRRQDALLLSSYGQHVRMYSIRFSGTIYDFIVKHSNLLVRYNYWTLLQRWASVFGRERIHVKVYERNLFPEGNIVAELAKTLGISLTACKLSEAHGINKNLSYLGLEVLRQLNSRQIDEGTHQKLIRLLDEGPLEGECDYELLSSRNRLELLAQFRNTNVRVARHWLGRDDGVLFESQEELSGDGRQRTYDRSNEKLVANALIETLIRAAR